MKCPKCNHENETGDKFCRKCGERLSHKCPECGHELKTDDRFCPECGTKLGESKTESAIPKLEDMHSQLQSLIPDILAQKYLSAEQQITAGENRPITALFADISGFTPLSATKSSEAIFHLVQDCFKQLVSIVAKYEGSISGFRGDGLLALFGAPILHENDAERAILAAIDMREAIKDYQLQVSIGINTAMMTVGEIQTQLHNEYTAYGNDINLAKRLQESAKPGQILVGAGSHRLTRRAFDFEIIPDLSLKGFTQSVSAYSVQQVKTHPEKLRGIEGLRARMIGREHEFTEVKDSVDEWLSGHGQIVSIIGEAGIGKSRLVSELKTYLSNKDDKQFQYIEGRCVSIGQPISYWPFIDILKTYFNLSEGDDTANIANKVTDSITQLMPQSADETLPLLGQLLSVKYGNELDDRLKFATPEQIRHQTLMRLRDIFTALARKQPLLLILEDLHWSDDLSLDLISLLMDELANTPLMILCIYRPEHDHRVWQLSNQARRKCMDRFTEITLKLLSSIESRELIEALLEIDNLPETIKKMIMEKSEGNPFFIEEVVRSLIEQGMIYQQNDRWIAKDEILSINVPDTIQSVILSRVDRLQSEAKYILQCASVIGRLFKHKLLDHLTHQEKELNHYISEFEDRELVYQERMIPELEYAFKHALTQEATYQSILERKRKEFHLQVAQGIERLYHERLEEYYDELADHYSKSDDSEKAIEYLLRAGEKAKKSYANESAISYYHKMIELANILEMVPKYTQILTHTYQDLGEIYFSLKEHNKAIEYCQKAIEHATNKYQKARIYGTIGWIYQRTHRSELASKYLNTGIAELGSDTKCFEMAYICIPLSWIAIDAAIDSDDFVRAIEIAKNGLMVVEGTENYLEIHELYTCILFAYGYGLTKYRNKAIEYANKTFDIVQKSQDNYLIASSLFWLGWAYIMNDENEIAIKFMEQGKELYEKIGHIFGISQSRYWISLTYIILASTNFQKNEFEKAIECSKKAFEDIDKLYSYGIMRNLKIMEEAHILLDRQMEFISYILNLKKEQKELFQNLKINQLYLEPSEITDTLINIDFVEEFNTSELKSGWKWLDLVGNSNYILKGGWLELQSISEKLSISEKIEKSINFDIPMLTKEISNDFVVGVIIKPASEDKPQQGGLLIRKDNNNFIRLEKGTYGKQEMRMEGYVRSEHQIAGRGFLPASDSDETYLRLERSGDEFTSYCSIGGENWFTCGKMTLPLEDPIQVGIYAHGTIMDRTIYCGEYKEGTATLFRNFRIWTKE